jgi:L-arabinose transport system ATP-binding protein
VNAATAEPPVLQLRGISKSFGPVRALCAVDLSVGAGRIVGLVGENGAGKSTLLRALAGDLVPDGGLLLVRGRPCRFGSPRESRLAGIRVVPQEPELVGPLTVAENIFLGALGTACGGRHRVRWAALHRAAAELIERCGFAAELRPRTVVADLGPGQRQLVEIVRALRTHPAVLALDEPTAALAGTLAERLLAAVRRLRERGVAIVYVSHRLGEVRRLADRIAVLRDGVLVATRAAAEVVEDDLVALMVGRPLTAVFARAGQARFGAERLRVDGLGTRRLSGVSFTVRAGEILGVAGLVGAGRTELARALFGAVPCTGRILLDGVAVRPTGPRAALAAGISMTPEDRRAEGLVPTLNVRENLTLSVLGRLTRLRVVRRGLERRLAGDLVAALQVKTASIEHPVGTLSGGNQQKVVLGRALSREPKVLILDEPTRGVDVGAKAEIYRLIRRQAEAGTAVLLVSSELPELLGLADRIMVLAGGRVTGELPAAQATEARVLALAMPPARPPAPDAPAPDSPDAAAGARDTAGPGPARTAEEPPP